MLDTGAARLALGAMESRSLLGASSSALMRAQHGDRSVAWEAVVRRRRRRRRGETRKANLEPSWLKEAMDRQWAPSAWRRAGAGHARR
jgi:hypothetical protein